MTKERYSGMDDTRLSRAHLAAIRGQGGVTNSCAWKCYQATMECFRNRTNPDTCERFMEMCLDLYCSGV